MRQNIFALAMTAFCAQAISINEVVGDDLVGIEPVYETIWDWLDGSFDQIESPLTETIK